jgi:hypothetical protein
MHISANESPNLQQYRSKAMLLASEDDCIRLYKALDEASLNYTGWSDDGADPDGSSWLIWTCDDALIAHANHVRVTYEVVDGFELPYPQEVIEVYEQNGWHLPDHWSGVSSEECAFIVNESDAVQFMRAVSETS